jgi:hypothetical protein
VLFLLLDLVMVIAATALFMGKVHKILQRRLHDREPLRAHARFWRWGTLSLGWALAFPLLYILVAQPAVGKLIDWLTADDDIAWGMLLVSGPVVLVLGFVGLAWAARGLRALGFLAKYEVPKLGTPVDGVGQGASPALVVPTPVREPVGMRTAEGGVRTGATQAVTSLGGIPLAHDDEPRVPAGVRTPQGGVRTGATEAYATVGRAGAPAVRPSPRR